MNIGAEALVQAKTVAVGPITGVLLDHRFVALAVDASQVDEDSRGLVRAVIFLVLGSEDWMSVAELHGKLTAASPIQNVGRHITHVTDRFKGQQAELALDHGGEGCLQDGLVEIAPQ